MRSEELLPIVVEILGVSGAGKSTLASHLGESLSAAGIQVVLSGHAESQKVGVSARLQGTIMAGLDTLRLARHFFRRGDSKHYALVRSTPSRLARAMKHGRSRRILALGLDRKAVILQEPGWPMQLLGHYQLSQEALKKWEARNFLARAPYADSFIILVNSPEVSLVRLRGRGRGVPQVMRDFSEAEIAEAIKRGTRASRIIAEAARSLGIETHEIDVSSLDANEVAARVHNLLLPGILARLNAVGNLTH